MAKQFALLFLVAALGVGCGGPETVKEYSDELHEDATIVMTTFTPSSHDTKFEPSFGGSGSLGYGPSGVGFRVGKHWQITTVTVPEKFGTIFRCKHGEFTVGRKEIYDRFKNFAGKVADVSYREVYETVYETKDGERKMVSRSLVDYDFLNAVLKE
jgi:hypothetical protein